MSPSGNGCLILNGGKRTSDSGDIWACSKLFINASSMYWRDKILNQYQNQKIFYLREIL